MRINPMTASRISAPGDVNQSAVVRQIKKLEQRKRKLEKKLAEMSEGGASAGTEVPAQVQVKTRDRSGTGAMPESASQAVPQTASSATIPEPAPAGGMETGTVSGPIDVGGLHAPANQASSNIPDPEDMMDPKEIMKLIMLLETQIMALKQRLDDEGQGQLANASDEDGEDSEQGASPLPGGTLNIDAPAADASAVTVESGHVDGYA